MKYYYILGMIAILSFISYSNGTTLSEQIELRITRPAAAPADIYISQGAGSLYNIYYYPVINAVKNEPITDIVAYTLNVARAAGAVKITGQWNTNSYTYGLRAADLTLNGITTTINLTGTSTAITLATLPGNGAYSLLLSFPATYGGTPNVTTTTGAPNFGNINKILLTCTVAA